MRLCIDQEKYWASLQCIYNFRDCPVDGGWTEWTRWTACQPVCGSGYRQRERFCRSPAPKNGGYQCIGPSYQNHHCFGRKCNKEGIRLEDKDLMLGRLLLFFATILKQGLGKGGGGTIGEKVSIISISESLWIRGPINFMNIE